MRIPLACPQCFKDGTTLRELMWLEEMVDNGLYKTVCPKGHHNTIVLQVDKCEVLFDLAINAIVDGYYREAVASFTASLERFYEFYANVVCEERGVSEDIFEKTWKEVERQSERQLCAFILLYLLQNGKTPPLLSSYKMTTFKNKDMVRFRNDVTHHGLIPTRDQALEYGRQVYEIITTVLRELKSTEKGVVLALSVASRRANRPHEKEPAAHLLVPLTGLCMNGPHDPNATFEKAVDRIRRERAFYKSKES